MAGIIATFENGDAYQPPELFAGDKPIITNAMLVAEDVELVANSILALDASNELVEWVPAAENTTAVAVAISCEAIDTTVANGGAAKHPVYKAGFFNTDALNWPDGTTDAQKLNAFIGTPIEHRTLGYSG